MLRLLAGSVVKVDETKELVFEYIGNPQDVTGVWREDGEKFTMTINEDSKPRRLIMGFGPSASGKTYWTKELIKMIFQIKILIFQRYFCRLTEGIAREKSAVYQKIIEVFKKKKNILILMVLKILFLQLVENHYFILTRLKKKSIHIYELISEDSD